MTTPTFTGYGLRDVAFSEVPADVARESVFAWYESFPKTGRVAFVDNSLLARVHALLQPENDVSRCTAEGMVALNTWLHAVVLYDHVVHLANPQVPDDAWTSNTALSGAMRAIDTDISLGARIGRGRYPGLHSYLEILLRGHGAQLRAMLADADAKRCLWDCWAAAFGTQQVNGVARLGWRHGPTIADLRFDGDWLSKSWSSDAEFITSVFTADELYMSAEAVLDRHVRNPLTDANLVRALTEACVRAHANMVIATNARATYVASPMRLPILAYAKADEEARWLSTEERVLRGVRDRTDRMPSVRDLVEASAVRVPPLLAAVLALCREQDPAHIVEIAGELRQDAAKLRKVMDQIDRLAPDAQREYEAAWADAESELTKVKTRMRDRLAKGAALVGLGWLFGEVTGLVGHVVQLSGAWAAKAIALAKSTLSGKAGAEAKAVAGQMRDRVSRRPGVFLAHLVTADGRTALHSAQKRMQWIWGIDNDRAISVARRMLAFSRKFYDRGLPRKVA